MVLCLFPSLFLVGRFLINVFSRDQRCVSGKFEVFEGSFYRKTKP